jgi:translation initiation factor IF-3
LVGSNGELIGVVPISRGLEMAMDEGLDLVEISPNATPPVCKIMDYGKFRYEQQKKAKEARKKQKTVDVKEVKIRPTIAEGDYNIKLNNARKFLEAGDKVRVSLQFRGREITHKDVGFNLVNKFAEDLKDVAKIDVPPKMEGRQIFAMLSPLK